MIDLTSLVKQAEGGEKSPSSVSISLLKEVGNKALVAPVKPSMVYFYCQKPNIGFPVIGNTRVRFKGNYYETSDPLVINYIKQHYGNVIVEITEEQKLDGTSFKY